MDDLTDQELVDLYRQGKHASINADHVRGLRSVRADLIEEIASLEARLEDARVEINYWTNR